MRLSFLVFAALLAHNEAGAQARYDLLLSGGHVIDPANRIDSVMDVAIADGKVARVAAGIPPAEARRVLDVKGRYVTPGLIDLHAHVYGYSGAISPDDSALFAATTTVVDAGGAGWRTFDDMKARIIDASRTRVLVFLNIVGHGMIGQKYEDDVNDMDAEKTAAKIRQHADRIVGIKVAHFGGQGWAAIDRAIAAGKLSNTPVMVDDKIFTNAGRTTREKLLDKMRPGDLHTHLYNDRQIEVVDRFSGKLRPWMAEARRRGVLFDLGHGAGSFLWPVATRAMAQGFAPDTISTDLHSSSIMIPESDMPNCISKLMALGMSFGDAVLRSTVNPAKAIRRFPELGTLGEGRIADIGVFRLASGVFAFKDAWHNKLLATTRVEAVLTIRAGEVVFEADDHNLTNSVPAQEIYDLILKGGHVVDPKNGRNERLDIAITGDRIQTIARHLPAAVARHIIDVSDYHVVPGLIDLYARFGTNGLNQDHTTLRYGVTTAVTSGSADIAKRSRTRIIIETVEPGQQAIGTRNATTMTAAMSQALASGLTLPQVVERTTLIPAKAIRQPELGSIDEGGIADIAVLETTARRVRCILTVRNGEVVWDTLGLSLTDWKEAGPYSNFK